MRVIPEELAEEVPPGAESVNIRSGTPEILAVNAIDPLDRADSALPEGAKMTSRASTMSTYSSFEVCLTLDFRHGMAGPAFRDDEALSVDAKEFWPPREGDELLCISTEARMDLSRPTLVCQPV